jgi:hypothetical protein
MNSRALTGLTAICVVHFCNSVVHAQLSEIDSAPVTHEKFNLQIVLYPPQLEMEDPNTLKRRTPFTFAELGSFSGILQAAVAGSAMDGIITLARDRPMIRKLINNTNVLAEPYDFQATVLNGLAGLTAGTDLEISDIELYRFESGTFKNANWMIQNNDLHYVMYLRTTYFMAPELDQLGLYMDASLFAGNEKYGDVDRLFKRSFQYLSPSRGNLFRPFDEGEKEALAAMVEEYFDYKVAKFPNNLKAYKKDRDTSLRALKGRDTILPVMAVNEGWTVEALHREIETATDHVLDMLRSDLIGRHTDKQQDVEFESITALSKTGKPWTFQGYAIGQVGANTFFRDDDGNMYSLPAEAPHAQ